MIVLSLAGLTLDLAGVLMLGFDLVRVQRQLRTEAEDRLASLNEVAEAAGGIDGFLKTVSGDFREYYRDEGIYLPSHGTFDHGAAQASFEEVKDSINGLADNLAVVANMLVATVESDRTTANKTLSMTYGGLALIILGFALQAPAYL